MLCNSDKDGVLFISEEYDDDPEPDGFAIPFTYTWDDNQGTLTAEVISYRLDTLTRETTTIPINYSKTTGLLMDLCNLYHLNVIALDPVGFGLERKTLYNAESLTNTEWQYSSDNVIGPGGGIELSYYLFFPSSTAAKLTYYQGGFYGGTWEFDGTYHYANGVGKIALNAGGWFVNEETHEGYFFLPDAQHLVLCDDESYILLDRMTSSRTNTI